MILLQDVTKMFKTLSGTFVAADHINLDVPEGEICILLGPSGCGKTTTLKMVNRLIAKTSGKIIVGGQDTDKLDSVALRRGMGYVIQQIGLFPNMTVEENICVVPELLGWDKAQARRRAAELLDMVALDPGIFLQRYPRQLSGGQQQRVGVARALAADPPVMIMDEPFGAIDPINREAIQDQFLRIQKTLRKTVMFVSHDIDEAVKMGNKIALFRAGKLEQYDTPDNILAHPVNSFVSDFVGSDSTLKRLRLLHVCSVIDRDIPTIDAAADTDRAAGLMREHRLDTIVVLNEQRFPIGRLHLAEIEEQQGRCGEQSRPVGTTVRLDDDLRTAVSTMFKHDVMSLVCVDGTGRFVGHVTQRAITHLLGETHRVAAARSGAVPQASAQ